MFLCSALGSENQKILVYKIDGDRTLCAIAIDFWDGGQGGMRVAAAVIVRVFAHPTFRIRLIGRLNQQLYHRVNKALFAQGQNIASMQNILIQHGVNHRTHDDLRNGK